MALPIGGHRPESIPPSAGVKEQRVIAVIAYKIGDEIKGFPVAEMSLTICNMTTSKTVDVPNISGLPPQCHYVIFTVAIHNLADQPIYFNRSSDFMERFRKAENQQLVLTFGAENHEVYPVSGFTSPYGSLAGSKNLNWGWGITMMNALDITSLLPFQTVYGALYFIMCDYYTLNELICREGFNSQPNFAISLKS